ncbi:toprim domain-containing protein [Frankia sp. QA3]|uniref:toprim domain-containing protein n=1 Tax=Frankia sp. QA3 TaxID=710111 RepID=UPI000269BC91|nr:toprim domain-containing protein [Frankia sp. QA3]EIV91318.1 hypothetical protein FraQA3DRAFT_0759 [Frankia sp. QA3]
MPTIDRDAVLDATDLAALATEICGEPHGRGRGARWHCPNADHPDEHPSMGIFQGVHGRWRWKCHACGEGGTAVDLLMTGAGMSVRDALLHLADRAGIPAAQHLAGVRPRRTAQPAPKPAAERPASINPAIGELVTAAADLLWQPVGSGALRYLHSRGFTDRLLAANRIGFDPGPRQLPRPDGLPHQGPGIVFPVLHTEERRPVYYQLRYLNPAHRRRYDQPAQDLAPNPKLAHLITDGPAHPGITVICEGFPDALTAAHSGLAAVALLGTGHASPTGTPALARRLTDERPHSAFVICFDDDTAANPGKAPSGQNAALRLADELAQHGQLVLNIQPPAGIKDLNAWSQHDPDTVRAAFRDLPKALGIPTLTPSPDGPELTDFPGLSEGP